MTKTNKQHSKKRSKKRIGSSAATETRAETRAGESLTVFWAVTVLTVLVANLVVVAAHFYLLANPAAEKMALLKGLMLFTGALVGTVSLVVLPILFRVRKVPPPRGLAVFAACVAAAPILSLATQMFQ